MIPEKQTVRRTKPVRAPKDAQAGANGQVKKRQILLVDDHPLMSEGLAGVISREPDLAICGLAGNPAQAISLLATCQPDLMVTDMSMPGRSGIEFIKDVHGMFPDLPVLVLSMHDEMLHAEQVLRANARGYLMKDAGSAKLLEVIRLILSGRSYVSPQISARLIDNMTGRRPRGSMSPIGKLSGREFEVFRLIGGGKSTKEVAQALGISPKTVEVHRAHIKEKLRLKDAPSLVYHAVRWVETHAAQS